ncbi:hypothetical protein DLJ53_02380 [Acuticoccus sediminis]|uniref:Uncharacterized protein n=1 Tax=Acuticoccus sediminis TaxID=2184697 RepID=A0A8B2NVK1_9HYPH|nr:hypothetical protein [Acuticoccus sediminis]RAI03383.1 hypothetical protein DLJ53_02380 [Acuticoccus sediminis]
MQSTGNRNTRPFGRWAVRLSCAALLAMGLAAFGAIVADAPGLSAKSRVAVGLDSWYPQSSAALYNRSLYMLDRASTASLRWQEERLSLKLALAGIEAAPANAYAWSVAAIAAASAGFDDFARTAAARSRVLAPNTARVAMQRLVLADIELQAADAGTRDGVRHDLEVARRHEPDALDTLLRNAPPTAEALHRLGASEPVAGTSG